MRTAVKFLMAGLFAGMFACSKPKLCTVPPEPILLRFVDANSRDLLSPSNPAGYSVSDITLTYIENGTSKPIPVTINQLNINTDQYVLNTDIGWYADQGRTFYLRLSPTDVDTIYARVDKMHDNCTWFKSQQFLYNNMTVTRGPLNPSSIYVYGVRK